MSANAYRNDFDAAVALTEEQRELIDNQRRIIAARDEQIKNLQSADYISDRKKRRAFVLGTMVMLGSVLVLAIGVVKGTTACVEAQHEQQTAADVTDFCEVDYSDSDVYFLRSFAYGANEYNKTLGEFTTLDDAVAASALLECPLHVGGSRPRRPMKGTSTP